MVTIKNVAKDGYSGMIEISDGIRIFYGKYQDYYKNRQMAMNAAQIWCDLRNGISVSSQNSKPASAILEKLLADYKFSEHTTSELSKAIQLLNQ